MAFPVLLDACVLVPIQTTDLLLRLASTKLFRPLWSDEILNETERNLIGKLAMSPDRARSRMDTMRRVFPDAMVTEYEALTANMTNDPKDRHVLAAAVRSGAEVIVTFNRKDFPAFSVAPYDIGVLTPDDFLLDQLDLAPDVVVSTVDAILRDLQSPSMSLNQYLAGLTRCGLSLFSHALGHTFGTG